MNNKLSYIDQSINFYDTYLHNSAEYSTTISLYEYLCKFKVYKEIKRLSIENKMYIYNERREVLIGIDYNKSKIIKIHFYPNTTKKIINKLKEGKEYKDKLLLDVI